MSSTPSLHGSERTLRPPCLQGPEATPRKRSWRHQPRRRSKRANAKLVKDGIAPIERVTFHSLRRSYASLRCACGDEVRYTADQLGHEDPRFTLRVYAQATKRRDRLTGPHLRAYDAAIEWAQMGTNGALVLPALQTEATKSPV